MTKNSIEQVLDSMIESKVVEVLSKLGFAPQTQRDGMDDVIKGLPALAEYLGVSYGTVSRLIDQRGFPYRKWTRIYLFRKSEVLDYMAKKTNRS